MNWIRNVIFALVGCAFVVMSALADIVKLKDGTIVEGTILEEDDKQIRLEVVSASGKIKLERVLSKVDVLEVKRSTAEEKSAQEMELAFQALKTHQLNPANSKTLAQYDQMIKSVFQAFLEKYPASPHAAEVSAMITAWQAERDQVAAGKAKARGKWMPAAEAAPIWAEDNAAQNLQMARSSILQNKPEQAIAQCRAAIAASQKPEIITQANAVGAEAYQKWLALLDKERTQLKTDIQNSYKTTNDLEQAVYKAQSNLYAAQRAAQGEKGKLGSGGGVTQAQNDLIAAQNNVKRTQEGAKKLREKQEATEKKYWEVQSVMRQPITTPVATSTSVARAPSGSPAAPGGISESPREGYVVRGPQHTGGGGDDFESVLKSKVTTAADKPIKLYGPTALFGDIFTGKGNALMVIGLLVMCIGGLWMLVVAFKENVLWGLACFIFGPFAQIPFAIIYWADAMWPLLISVTGWILLYSGAAMR